MKPKRRKPPLPVDRGWAWLVMLGASLNFTVVLAFIRSGSVLLTKFIQTYNAPATITTLAFGLAQGAFSLINVLMSVFLLKRFTVRKLALAGAVLHTTAISVMVFASSIVEINVAFAILGFSQGLIAIPQLTLVGYYFHKRRSFATGCAVVGAGLGTMVGPPFTHILLEYYGLSGTLLIFTGLSMNCIVAALLFRPISQYSQPDIININDVDIPGSKENCTKNENEIKDTYKDEIPETTKRLLDNSCDNICENIHVDAKCLPNNLQESSFHQCNDKETINIDHQFQDLQSGDSICDKNDRHDDHDFETINAFDLDETFVRNNEIEDPRTIRKSSQHPQNSQKIEADFSTSNDAEALEASEPLVSNKSTDSGNLDTGIHSSSNRINGQVSSSTDKGTTDSKTLLSKLRTSISNSIYTHPIAILLLAAFSMGVQNQGCGTYVAALGQENGLTSQESALLLTVIGVADLICKPVFGYFSDLGLVKNIYIPFACNIALGSVLQFTMFYQGFGWMVMLSIVMGLTYDVLFVFIPIVTIDSLGIDHVGHMLSGFCLISGVLIMVEHIIAGALKDTTGSFVGIYNLMGGMVLLSAVLMLFEPLVVKCSRPLSETSLSPKQ